MVNKYKVINKQILNVGGEYRTFVLLEYDVNNFEAPKEIAIVNTNEIAKTISESDIIE